MKLNNRGFSAIEGIAILVIVAIIGFVGWKVYSSQDQGSTDAPQITEQQSDAEQAPDVNSSEDLEQAEDYLNEQNIDEQLDTSEIDEALAE